MRIFNKKIVFVLSAFFVAVNPVLGDVVKHQLTQIADASPPTLANKQIFDIAERVGLKPDFEHLSAVKMTGSADLTTTLVESHIVKRLWQAQIQLDRVLAQIDEERLNVSMAIGKCENRKFVIANTLDSVNFLSSSIIAIVGNGLFIPAPPPRPTIPNILFSVSNGLSMGLSTLSLLELQGGKAKLQIENASMLSPLFLTDYNPSYSGLVWTYLNSKPDAFSETPRQKLLRNWLGETKSLPTRSAEQLSAELALKDRSFTLSLKNLHRRQEMLSQLEIELVQLSKLLSQLGHSV